MRMIEEYLAHPQVGCNPSEKTAFQIRRGGVWRIWTYRDVWKSACAAAAQLRAYGLQPGERVALCGDNSPEWVLAYLGVYLAGGVVVPLDAQYGKPELRNLLAFARCRAAIAVPEKACILESIRADVGLGCIIVLAEGWPPPVAPLLEPLPRHADEQMAVIYTSGTTGEPKGVCLSVGNITANCAALLQASDVTATDVVLCLLPLHHCYAMTASVLAPLMGGCAITFCASLRGPDILAAIRETGVTVAPVVPRFLEGFERGIREKLQAAPWPSRVMARLLASTARRLRRWSGWNPGRLFFPEVHAAFGPQLRYFVSGGARLEPDLAERLMDFGLSVVEGYGLTEAAPVVTLNPVRQPRVGSVGRPLPGVEVQIDSPDAEGVGEVLVRGPNVMLGYDQRPDETAKVLRDGWLHTGDLGYLDDEGFLHITGRVKEVIVLPSGKKIYPEDVERHYQQSPLVKEICVTAVERADGRVERLRAVVVPDMEEIRRRGIISIQDEVRREISRLSQLLPSWMRLATEVKITRGELPRTPMGKLRRGEIQRVQLDEVLAGASVGLHPEEEALLATPAAQKVIARVREITGYQGPITPVQHLELDLGLDSLNLVELAVMLQEEFRVAIPLENLGDVATVGDVLRLLPRAQAVSGLQGGEVRWADRLRQRLHPPLPELFPLERGWLERGCVDAVRHVAFRVAQALFPLAVQGSRHLPAHGPFLLCPTHSSFLDAVLIFLCLPDEHAERVFFLGAEEFFRTRLMRRVARAGRVIPTATRETVLPSLQRAAEALELGYSVCIFPEGAITRDGYLQPPRPGAGILACELGVPIVPVLIRGTYDILSYAHPGFRLRPVGVTFGEPIRPPPGTGFTQADYAALMSAWQRAIVCLRDADDAAPSRTAGRSPRIRAERAAHE